MASKSKPFGLTLSPNLDRRASARRAAVGGRDAETLWNASHEKALSMGHAFVYKVPIPYRVMGGRPDGTLIVRLSEKVGCDYEGVMLDGTQRRVFAEAKSSSDDMVDLAAKHGGLRDHQRETLTQAVRNGDVALVLLRFGPLSTGYAVPFTDTEGGLRKCREHEMESRWKVPFGESYLNRFVAVWK